MTDRADEKFTIVSFHAHPDDEALLTGGTLARAAAEGHRVVLVVATNGGAGLSADAAPSSLGSLRHQELLTSALALGAPRVEALGYPTQARQAQPRGPSRPWIRNRSPASLRAYS